MLFSFSLFFGTFDAVILISSIYILFPKEHPELVQSALQHFRWAFERFSAMSDRNALAKSALGILQAVYVRLKKSLGITCLAEKAMLTCHPSALGTAAPSPFSFSFSFPETNVSSHTGTEAGSPQPFTNTITVPTSDGNMVANHTLNGAATSSPTGLFLGTADTSNFDWNLPNDFNWASLQPIYATGDLLYNDLSGQAPLSSSWATDTSSLTSEADQQPLQHQIQPNHQHHQHHHQQQQQPWQFEGDFGNDSVWNLLNQYQPF
jgi:hypothetical protein